MGLRCGRHGYSELVSVVCTHVIEGTPIECSRKATSAIDGLILCGPCNAAAEEDGRLDNLLSRKKLCLICERCADLIARNQNQAKATVPPD
jgi:hypothetical protein